jgi:hypothetical protein
VLVTLNSLISLEGGSLSESSASLERNEQLNEDTMRALDAILREHNLFPEILQFEHEVLQTSALKIVPLQMLMKIINDDGTDQRKYHQPTTHEIALLLADDNLAVATRDVIMQLWIIEQNSHPLRRISSTNSLYHPLTYCFPRVSVAGTPECNQFSPHYRASDVI